MKLKPEDITLEQVHTALNLVPGGFVIYGPNHELLFVNDIAREHFPVLYEMLESGKPLRGAIEAEICAQFPHADDTSIRAMVAQVHGSVVGCTELEMATANGLYVKTLHARLPNGSYIGLLHDITELRLKERKLRKASKAAEAANAAKSAFLAAMSHEIRTPLNGILGMSQALSSRDLAAEEQEMITTIVESSHNLMAVLNDILDISRIEAGKLTISPVPGDLRHKLSRIESFYRPIAEEKGLWFRLVVSPNVPAKMVFDPIRIRQCIDNLVSNALKFTSEGGVIVAVTLDETSPPDAPLIKIHVSDTGIGISPDQREDLFAVFSQADASTTRQYGGSGLGLSISRKLARQMGGDVTVASKQGEGSVFTLTFTAESLEQPELAIVESAAPLPAPAPSARSLRDKRILIVDDNEVNRRVARLFLEPRGVIVSEAIHGREALEELSQSAFDIVLLDIHMPVMDGPETLRAIRASGQDWAKIPVIALTADAMSGDRERYIKLGMDGYVSKPVEERTLISSILEQLARPIQSAIREPETMPPSEDGPPGVDVSALFDVINEVTAKSA